MLGGRDRAAGVRWSPHICGRGVVIIIIMKLWPASEPWSWYMYENALGTRSARAAAPDLEAAEAELAAATRVDGVEG